MTATKTSQYGFTKISPAKGAYKIALEPTDNDPAIPGDLALILSDKIKPEDAAGLWNSLNDKIFGVSFTKKENTSDVFAGWVIGSYLVLHTLLLVGVSLVAWLTPFRDSLSSLVGVGSFDLFQRLVLSACAAGLGGGVYMIGQFFQKFAYGWKTEYLERKEIPRYVLLPFSSVVLGPISFAFVKVGAIPFASISKGAAVPIWPLVTLCFILGFTYHDTLNALAKFSEKIFTSKKSGDPK